jgi:hypothetical protein
LKFRKCRMSFIDILDARLIRHNIYITFSLRFRVLSPGEVCASSRRNVSDEIEAIAMTAAQRVRGRLFGKTRLIIGSFFGSVGDLWSIRS